MTGYVRKDTTNNIADGNIISAADLDAEFDGVVDAFNASTGHTHGGGVGEGAPITTIGPTQDVVASASALTPKTTNTVDIGSSSLKFKDFYLAGNANIAGTTTLGGALTYGGVTLSNAVTGTGNMVLSTSPTLTTPDLGTPSAVTLTNATGLPVSTGISGLGANVATFLATPSSANLAAAVTDETGSGALVFATSPTLTTPTLGVASATSINKVALTAPATGSTLTIADGKTLTANSSLTLAGTDATTMTFPATSATIARTDAAQTFTGTQTFSSNPILNGGTANGVLYLDGSKVATSGSALTFDGTNLGLGGAPVAVGSSPVFEIYSGTNNGILKFTNSTTGTTNSDGTWLYQPAGTNNFIVQNQESAGELRLYSTTHIWSNYNNSTEYMRLTSTGLGIGTSSPGAKLDVQPATYTFGTAQAEVIRIRGNASGGSTTSPTSAGALVWGNGATTQAVINSIIDNPSASSRSALAFSTNIAGTLTEAMRLDSSGNLGLGVTPSAWGSGFSALDLGGNSRISGSASMLIANNAFFNGTNWIYKNTATAGTYSISNSGVHSWSTAPSGTAGNTISFTQALTLDANRNLLLNGTTAGASAVGTLAIFNGTAPTGSVTDGIILYAEDVSSSSELKVRDEAGNVTTLSPHNFSLIPEGPSEEMAWAYYSEKGGKRINVDMLKLARMVEKLTGEKLVYES